MRSAGEIREAKLAEMRFLIQRPGQLASDGESLELIAHRVLGDLCFIDERDDEARSVGERLRRFGKLGVTGAFEAVFGEDCRYGAEVVSVFAQQLAGLGYLDVERFSEPRWQALTTDLRERYDGVDVRRSGVVADLGEASLVVDKRVLCYVGTGNDEWIFFDFWEPYVAAYDSDRGNFGATWSEDPLLRDIRVPAAAFDASLILTKYGRAIRWGPGWWLRDDQSGASAPAGVVQQLRTIEAADPSQSLGLHRP